MQKATRTVSEYGIDAHREDSPIDYEEAFELLASLDPRHRVTRPTQLKAVALEHAKRVKKGRWHLVFLRGTHDEVPVLLNAASGKSEVQELGENRFLAYRTHMVISVRPDSRAALLEYSHYGAKSGEIAVLLETLLQQATGKPHSVSLKPRVDGSFAKQVKKLSRIVEASATISLPNPKWKDYEGLMTSIGDASEAGRVGIHATARNGDTLAKNSGPVGEIVKQSIEGGPIESAFVRGQRRGEEKPVRVSFLNFMKKIVLAVRREGRTGVNSQDLLAKMDEQLTYMDEEQDS